MTTLREFLVSRWGEEVLENPVLTGTGADQDFDEEITRKFRSDDGSYLVMAGDSAVVSTPTNILSFPADDFEEHVVIDDWTEVDVATGRQL